MLFDRENCGWMVKSRVVFSPLKRVTAIASVERSYGRTEEREISMKKILVYTISFLSILLLSCAAEHKMIETDSTPEERCDVPVWNVGDYWKFQLEDRRWWSLEVIKVETDLYIVKNPFSETLYGFDTHTLQKKVDITPQGRRTTSKSPIGIDFPLYVGKKWDTMFEGRMDDNTRSDVIIAFKVISVEDVTVPAGTLKAFKIEQEVRPPGTGNSEIYHLWYAPVAKNVVKCKFFARYGTWAGTPQNYEMTSYKVKSTLREL